ncbi:MAG: beta-ketoacyl-[acyl-carrier-protein] synthase II, partial [Candidatus Zixiibacteriota bacterium]
MQGIRAVVTGMGVITPLGCDLEKFWQDLADGKSGIGKVTRFDVSDYSTRIAAEVKDFDGDRFFEKKELRRLDLVEQYAIAASQIAIDDSGLNPKSVDPYRAGVIIASGIGGI